MMRRLVPGVWAGMLVLGMWLGSPTPAQAQNHDMNRFFYYPYYYFPHNYWPTQSPKWPENTNAPYKRYPAYMTSPPFKEPQWRYDYFEPHLYYRGFHFWLDQF